MNVATEKQVQIIRPLAEYSANARVQRVAAYCRVSTDSDDQVNSFLNQVRYYTDFIRTTDKMELVDIYADEGITGTSLNKREDFKRMLNDARLGKIDRIYVKSVQRFARNSLECLESVRKLAEYGASVYFENDRIDTRSMSSEMILARMRILTTLKISDSSKNCCRVILPLFFPLMKTSLQQLLKELRQTITETSPLY